MTVVWPQSDAVEGQGHTEDKYSCVMDDCINIQRKCVLFFANTGICAIL